MSFGAGDSRRKLPPFAAGLVTTGVAMVELLARGLRVKIQPNCCLKRTDKTDCTPAPRERQIGLESGKCRIPIEERPQKMKYRGFT
jgi:hypothetical protein